MDNRDYANLINTPTKLSEFTNDEALFKTENQNLQMFLLKVLMQVEKILPTLPTQQETNMQLQNFMLMIK